MQTESSDTTLFELILIDSLNIGRGRVLLHSAHENINNRFYASSPTLEVGDTALSTVIYSYDDALHNFILGAWHSIFTEQQVGVHEQFHRQG